jgi:hypothetical protein
VAKVRCLRYVGSIELSVIILGLRLPRLDIRTWPGSNQVDGSVELLANEATRDLRAEVQ